MFEFTNKNYNLRDVSILKRNRYLKIHYGSDSLVSLAPEMLELVPDSIREVKILSIFQNKIKTDKSPCENFAKIMSGTLSLFKAVPITIIAIT